MVTEEIYGIIVINQDRKSRKEGSKMTSETKREYIDTINKVLNDMGAEELRAVWLYAEHLHKSRASKKEGNA